jgi:hypothetical protein
MVTGVAGDPPLAGEVVLVEDRHHFHHFPCLLLGLLFVFVERSLYVTMIATNSQGRTHELHRWHDFFGRRVPEHLNVLVDLIGCFPGPATLTN